MGVQIVAAPPKGQQVLAPPPYAFSNGNTAQPGPEITWRLSPAVNLSVQIVGRRSDKVVAKGRRAAVESHLEELLLFLGEPIDVKSAASPVPPVAGGASFIAFKPRELLE